MKSLTLSGLALLATVAAGPSMANILTFDGKICNGNQACSNFSYFDQNYGDVAGEVDVQYDRDVLSGGPDALSYWNSYSDLRDIAWGGSGDTSGRAEIFLKPLGGRGITLNGLDFGSFQNLNRTTQLSILTGAGDALFVSSTFTVGALRKHFVFNLTSFDGIRIQFGPNAYNVGIDNVDFTVTAVPEPETYALMAAGLVMVGAMVRRRRAQA